MTDESQTQIVLLWEILLKDSAEAMLEAKESGAQFKRRVACREFFTFVEATTFMIKDVVLRAPPGSLTNAELAVLRDEHYSLKADGEVMAAPKFGSPDASFVFAINLYMRNRATVNIDKQGNGWCAFRESLKVRNRITHPKKVGDIEINDRQFARLREAYDWFIKTFAENFARGFIENCRRHQEVLRHIRKLESEMATIKSTLEAG